MRQDFSLHRFGNAGADPALSISGSISRDPRGLMIDYRLRGDLDRIDLPPRQTPPRRRDGLWQRSCIELFIAVHGQTRYWELNLSPGGDWNCYHFRDYRQQMSTETAIDALPFTLVRSPRELHLTLKLPAALPLPAAATLDIGISAVIQATDGELSYWALEHPADRPDFHRRDGFTLTMAIP